MVVAAGLSPAWQQVLVVDGFTPGQVNRARDAYWCASGKVINVGVALHHLSGGVAGSTLTLSTLGGPALPEIDRELESLGLRRRWVRTDSPTRVCTTIVDEHAGASTELVENAGPISAAELAEFERVFAEVAGAADVVVLTGSLPVGAPTDFFLRLLKHIRGQAVLDIRGAELLAALEARPFMVKPNRDELAQTLGVKINNDDDMKCALGELLRRGAQSVVVSSGPDPVWIAAEGAIYRMEQPAASRIVNSIGCGDCMAAGIAWSLHQGEDIAIAIEAGLHFAVKNLETLLPSDFDGRREQICRR